MEENMYAISRDQKFSVVVYSKNLKGGDRENIN